MRNHFLRANGVPGSSFSGVTDNLVFHIDAGDTSSYSGSGTTVNSLVGSITSSGWESDVTYSSSDGGSWVFGRDPNTTTGINFPNGSYLDYGTGEFTFEAWMKTVSSSDWDTSNFNMFMGMAGDTTVFSGYLHGGNKKIKYYGGSKKPSGTNGDISNDMGEWFHWVLTFTGATITDQNPWATFVTYLNGAVTETNTKDYFGNPSMNFDSNTTLSIGGIENAGTSAAEDPWQGNISIVRIYKGKALTSSEVTQNYNAEKSRYGY